MKAEELIRELQKVNPETEVTITTDSGTEHIDRVVTMGYNDPVTIVTY